jgi:hypothetical protein
MNNEENINRALNEATVIYGIQTAGYLYRGQIINDTIYLERRIDEALTRHFCVDEEKKKELFELIIASERMTFSNKIQVFEYLFRKHHKAFVEKYPLIFADLKNINEERNIVAHYLLDTSKEGKEAFINNNKFGFVKFRNSTETIWREQKDYTKFHELQNKYILAMNEFLST